MAIKVGINGFGRIGRMVFRPLDDSIGVFHAVFLAGSGPDHARVVVLERRGPVPELLLIQQAHGLSALAEALTDEILDRRADVQLHPALVPLPGLPEPKELLLLAPVAGDVHLQGVSAPGGQRTPVPAASLLDHVRLHKLFGDVRDRPRLVAVRVRPRTAVPVELADALRDDCVVLLEPLRLKALEDRNRRQERQR